MFKDIRFLVHTSVQAADDVAITIQNHRGRVVLTLAGADVVLMDRGASIPVAAHAEVIHYTWVDLCLKHGLRLPYTYTAGLQDYTRPVGDSNPAMSRDESSPRANRSATSPTIASTEDVTGRRAAFEHGRSSREAGILPVPCPSILGFNAGGGKNHPSKLRDYFENFLTAIWTLDPSRRLDTAMQDLLQILPNLSVYSLRSFEKTQQHRVRDARMNGLAASRSGVAAGATVEGEVKKLLKALGSMDTTRSGDNGDGMTAPRRDTDVRPRETTGIQLPPRRPKLINPTGKWGHHRIGLDIQIGSTTVKALLSAPDLPALPTDDRFESKYAFYDTVLQWVLEREPTASRFPINSFVYELGGRKMFTERSFESSYKMPARIARYKQIRQSVLDRWRSGELGTLTKGDEAVIAYIDHTYDRSRIIRPGPPLARVRSGPGGTTTRSSDQLARLGGVATTASTRSRPSAPSPGGHAQPAAYRAPSAGAAESGGNGHSVDDPDDETEDEEDEHHEESPEADSDGDNGMDVFMFDDGDVELKETQEGDVDPNSVHPTAPDRARENPTRAVFLGLDEETALHDLVQSFLWFEDYASQHKLDTEARAAKRATIWQHMAIKFKCGTDESWEEFYESNQAEIERRVQASRVRPAARRSFYY